MKSLDDYGCASVPAVETDKPAAQRHTPGPWRVSDKRIAGRYITPAERGNIYGFDVISAAGSPVVRMTCDDVDMAQTDADSRLIAAAPELLKALCKIADSAGRYGERGTTGDGHQQAIQTALFAIRLATTTGGE